MLNILEEPSHLQNNLGQFFRKELEDRLTSLMLAQPLRARGPVGAGAAGEWQPLAPLPCLLRLPRAPLGLSAVF